MKAPVDSIRLSQADRDRLIRIKRFTGIESWNVLCRWALLLGLKARKGEVDELEEGRDALEIKWDTFAGPQSRILIQLIQWCYHHRRGAKNVSLSQFVHGRLAHGILIISKPGTVQNVTSLATLISR
jgi:DNA sulfur modification protein DndE